ncbi:SMC-Scp complex subunit ScpB [Marinicellulosiphila megalodicopiae]|uniref:SMC-Scp complex subunit ScpB n=1 Tax=Marinicellulosiphila megalodicopiae TaxID=2724896 RepID=UPI003BB1ED88
MNEELNNESAEAEIIDETSIETADHKRNDDAQSEMNETQSDELSIEDVEKEALRTKAQDDLDVQKDDGAGFSLRLNEAEGDFEQMLEDYDTPEENESDFQEEAPEELAEIKGRLPYGGFEPTRLKGMLEGMVFAAGKTITLGELQRLFEDQERPSKKDIKCLLAESIVSYENQGIELIETAAGYRFQTRQQDALWIARLFGEKPQKYSRAMLETIALIAYRQPITRGEIEDVRGVAVSSYIIKTLLERQWIRVVGHREVPGRPAMFATTKQFLDYFGLSSLSQMPTMAEIKNIEDINPQMSLPDTGSVDVDKEASLDELVNELKDETKEREADTYLDEQLAGDLKQLDEVNKTIEVSFAAQRAGSVSEDDPDYEKSKQMSDGFDDLVKSFNDENPVQYDQPLPKLAEGFEEIAQSFDKQLEDSDEQQDEDQATDDSLSASALFNEPESQTLSENQQLQRAQDEISQEEQMRIIEEKLAQQAALIAAQSLEEPQDEDEF